MPLLSRRFVATVASAVLAAGATAGVATLTESSRATSAVTAVTAGGRAAPLPHLTKAPTPVERAATGQAVRPGGRGAPARQAASVPTGSTRTGAIRTGAGSGYMFLFPQTANGPVRWNPCEPVHYVTNLAEAPQLRPDVTLAMARLSAATGLRFVYDGDTTEHSSSHRPLVDRTRGGSGWAPVLVDVATPAQSDLLRDGDDGEGVATWWHTSSSGTQIVTGQLVLRAGSIPTRVLGFDDPDAAGPFLLHELGHVLGLGHVGTPGAIMNHDGALRGTTLSAGDLAGLHLLGVTQGCLPVLTPPALNRASAPLSLVH